MPLESPTFEQKSFYPKVTKLTHVDPENLISKLPANSVSLQSRKALLNAIQISSVFSCSCFYSAFNWSSYFYITYLNSASRNCGSLFFKYVDTSLPHWPCPSHTEKKWQYFKPQKWGTVIQLSWFYLLGFDGAMPVLVANANFVTAFVLICFGLQFCSVYKFYCWVSCSDYYCVCLSEGPCTLSF